MTPRATARDDTPPVEPEPAPIIMRVSDAHHIASASWAARELAARLGARRSLAFQFATAVSELAANLVFHTDRGGTIAIAPIGDALRKGIEVAAEDEGPGIADLDLAMTDGFTTSGGLGCGLPGVKRLMDEFEIESAAGKGTRVVARVWL